MSADLNALLERVRGASGPDRELDAAILCALPPFGVNWKPDARWQGRANFEHSNGDGDSRRAAPFTASIDACAALIERKLPARWEYNMGTCGEDDMPWASITEPDEPCRDFAASAPTIPLALIEALLLALQSNEATNGE